MCYCRATLCGPFSLAASASPIIVLQAVHCSFVPQWVGTPFEVMTFDSFQNDFSRNFDILQICIMLASNQRKVRPNDAARSREE